jgi:hypothetical protein
MSKHTLMSARTSATLALAALLLAGCSGNDMSRTFGFTRDAPDEHTATTQVPLSMPPGFSARPPSPGAQQLPTQQEAEQAPVPPTASTAVPPGQAALVQAAGPPPPANIRAQVDRGASDEAQQSDSFVDKLMFWQDDAAHGRTPIIQRSDKKGWLGGLF